MGAKAFVTRIETIETSQITQDAFAITLGFTLVGSQTTGIIVGFEAMWGADWRLLATDAIKQFCASIGEDIDGIVFPDLTTV